MSIVVDLSRLPETLSDFGAAYLLTVSPDGRVKAISTVPYADSGLLHVPNPSRGTSANLEANQRVTLLWPPLQPTGYSLIVDGTAIEVPEGGGFVVTPLTAVLHRPADHSGRPG